MKSIHQVARHRLGAAVVALCVCIFQILSQSVLAAPTLPKIDHSDWDSLLKQYVGEGGLVDYSGWKDSGVERLEGYISRLAEPGREPLSGAESKALLINAYNALTIKWILANCPVKSIHATANPFDKKRHQLAGERVSLNGIEQRLQETGDPRVHAVLVCAARSCPPLRREAYVADRLDQQLDEATRRWLAVESLNQFLPDRREVRISRIFKWYRKDFERTDGGLVDFLQRYAPPRFADLLQEKKLRIKFLDYHWGLNDQSDLGKNYSTAKLVLNKVTDVFR